SSSALVSTLSRYAVAPLTAELTAGSARAGKLAPVRASAAIRAGRMGSISMFVLEYERDGFGDDVHVQPERPVAQIGQIVVDALLHFLEAVGLAAPAVDLGPARDAGLDLVPHHVTLDHGAIELVVGHRMRTR